MRKIDKAELKNLIKSDKKYYTKRNFIKDVYCYFIKDFQYMVLKTLILSRKTKYYNEKKDYLQKL